MKPNKLYITTPIYYVNDYPHIGHAYTTIAADILARWHRLQGRDVFFLTGTDEHGAKICEAAKKNNQTPQAFCDVISEGFRDAWKTLNINYTDFIRTTDRRHEAAVRKLLTVLHDKGFVYKSTYHGLYCVGCEKFMAEADLDENGCCPDHRQKPARHEEENYFFRLSAFQEPLLALLSDENDPRHIAILPRERRNEILGKIRLGLEDISISRAALPWGIPLPFDEKQTVYVWVDALINYISAVGYAGGADGGDAPSFTDLWPAGLHLMAKDILWFHSVIWPAMLMAADLPLPKKVFAHGFFTIDGDKMSKTIGNVIRPAQLTEKFGVDAARYLTVSLFPFGHDGDISWDALSDKYNVDLANNFGNLISRTVSMTQKYFSGAVPPAGDGTDLVARVQAILAEIPATMDGLEFHKTAERLQAAVTLVNQQIEQDAPWKLAKTSDPRLGPALHAYLQSSAVITLYLAPFMPDMCQKIWASFGGAAPVTEAARNYFAGGRDTLVCVGAVLANPGILFPRIQK